MDKAIIVINTPDGCRECPLCGEDHMTYRDYCRITDQYIWALDKPDWCPLKPAPKKMEVSYGSDEQDWENGYNSCVEQIMDT